MRRYIVIVAVLLGGALSALPGFASPRVNVVKIYGAGGPHTAIKKVAQAWEKKTGNKVSITAGPEKSWSQDAKRDADILWGTSEQSMTAFLRHYPAFSAGEVRPIYIRPAVIAVRKGNPKKIQRFEDLLAPGIRVVVTEGAGVYNTSGTGVWEDVAGRRGQLDDVIKLRANIVAYSLGSGAAFRDFQERHADAWITWPNWPLSKPDTLAMVPLDKDRAIWRDLNVVSRAQTDDATRDFLSYLADDPEAQRIMSQEGWIK